MELDRQLQYDLLYELRTYYPEQIEINKLKTYDQNKDNPILQRNIWYLHEHGLIEGIATRYMGGVPNSIIAAKISVQGLDFLESDGGISAILKTITVKFTVDNIRDLLHDKIIASTLSLEQKKTITQKLKSLSGDVLKDMITEIVTKGLENPTILAVIIDMLSRL